MIPQKVIPQDEVQSPLHSCSKAYIESYKKSRERTEEIYNDADYEDVISQTNKDVGYKTIIGVILLILLGLVN
jgi:hypothetical protein